MSVTPDPTQPITGLGQSDAYLAFQEQLSRVAPVDRAVLLVGERGTGKELAAQRLHYLSRRWDAPLVTLNCAALSASLLEAELFGHEAGAFTGATRARHGRFETADGGTLFLDEIGLVPLAVQEKILRAVEYGSFERVGSSQATQVDVRIVAATNVDLRQRVAEGAFKQDLLDRLSFEVLSLPPLRERGDDIELLAAHFAAHMAVELDRPAVPSFSRAAIRALESYAWPGNVRQLKNVIERAVYRSSGDSIDAIDFDPFKDVHALPDTPRANPPPTAVTTANAPAPDLLGRPLKEAVRDLECDALHQALTRTRGHQRRAADLLGLSYDQFRRLYRKHRERMG